MEIRSSDVRTRKRHTPEICPPDFATIAIILIAVC